MKKLAFTLMMVVSTFSQAAEFKFEWKGTVPAATTYVQDTISYNAKFDINAYKSLTFVERKVENKPSIQLITLADF